MSLSSIASGFSKTVKSNSPEILTALGVSGVITTAYLAGKAAYKASKIVEADEVTGGVSDIRKERVKNRTKLTWTLYIPPAVTGAITIACIVGASKSSNKRTAAAVTAYSLTERAFSEYKEKVVQEFGKNKQQKLQDDLAQSRVTANPISGREVLVVGKGQVLCFDSRSCRYFRSSMEELRRAENEINFQLNHERHVGLSEFYALLSLPITKESVYNGWTLDRALMELQISTTLSETDEPCLVIDFNYCQPFNEETWSSSPPCLDG